MPAASGRPAGPAPDLQSPHRLFRNGPGRRCTGYVGDIGVPPPHAGQDVAARMECWLGGAWCTFDPRNLHPMRGRVPIAYGGDAADVPLTHSFGPNVLTGLRVWIDEAG